MTISFLFITKEGTCGTIQLKHPLGPDAAYTDGGLHFRYIYEAESASPSSGPAP